MADESRESKASQENDDFEIEIGPGGNAEDRESSDSELKELKARLEKSQSDYLYLRAEFDNYKKQMIKERSDYIKYGNERLLVDVLDVLDNFERALKSELNPEKPETIDSFRKGIDLTANEFQSVLKKFGVEQIDAEGKPFDPNVHEALSSEETDKVEPGYVTNVFRNGYKLHDRVIRPAQVVVAKAKSSN